MSAISRINNILLVYTTLLAYLKALNIKPHSHRWYQLAP